MRLIFKTKKSILIVILVILSSIGLILVIKQNMFLKKTLNYNTDNSLIQSKNNDLQTLGFNGKIKSIQEYVYHNEIEFLGIIFRGRKSYYENEYFFNEDGNFTYVFQYKMGYLSGKTLYHYDLKGNIQEKEDYFNIDDDGYDIETSTFDENGNLLRNKRNFKERPTEIFEYNKYDKRGRLIEKREGSVKNEDSWWDYDFIHRINYDSDGDKVTEIVYNAKDESLISKTNFNYNEKKNLVEENEYNYVNKSPWLRTNYIYDYENRLINKVVDDLYFNPPVGNNITIYTYYKEILYQKDYFIIDHNGIYSKSNTETFDINGNLIRRTDCILNTGDFNNETRWKYDESGNLIEKCTDYYKTYYKTVFKYNKGEKGWIKKKEYTNGELSKIIIRRIKYF